MGKGVGFIYLIMGIGVIYIRFFSGAFPETPGILAQYFLPVIGIVLIIMGFSTLFGRRN